MRHLIVVLTLITALLVPASASAAFKNGTYAGKFKQGGKLTFVVKNKKIVSVKASGLPWECDEGTYSGAVAWKPGDAHPESAIPVSSKGNFNQSFATPPAGSTVPTGPQQPPDRWALKGKLGSTGSASGTGSFNHVIRTTGADGESNYVDCATGLLSFSAKIK